MTIKLKLPNPKNIKFPIHNSMLRKAKATTKHKMQLIKLEVNILS